MRWYQRHIRSVGRLRITLIFKNLLREHIAPGGTDDRRFETAQRQRHSVPAGLRRGLLALLGTLAAMAALGTLPGCNTINPNLGAAPTQTSNLTVLTPAAAAAGTQCTPSCTLTVNGQGFVSGSTVTFNGAGLTTTFVNSTLLTAALMTANLTKPGNAAVGVTSPGPTTGNNAGNNLSNFLLFTIGAANNPIPAITQLSPSSAAVGGPAFTVTVTGTNFVLGTQVNWNGSPLTTTFVSATQLTAAIPAADIATQGSDNVSVVNPAPGGGPSGTIVFTVTSKGMAATAAGEKTSLGGLAGQLAASGAAISAGSRYIAFVATDASVAANTETNVGVDEIFMRDTCQGAGAGAACTPQTILVSAALIGTATDGASRTPSISANGRFVVFASDATNLVPGDNNGVSDIFLRDTCIGGPAGCTPTTTLISVAFDGSMANAASAVPSISADGRYVAFQSDATNLVPGLVPGGMPSSVPTDSAVTVTTGAFLRDTCFGVSGACTSATVPLATSDASAR
jgi:WD40-like Beta Propeller Repeat